MQDKILLVDDEPAVLEGYTRLLHRDFPVQTALSGAAALALVHTTGPYSVVISDMRMPGMNGAEFFALLREKAPNTVRILLTGYSDLSATINAVNRGRIFRFLSKPCPKEVLIEAIAEGIAQYRAAESEMELAKKSEIIGRSDSEWDADEERRADNFEGLAGLLGAEQAKQYLQELFRVNSQDFVVLIKLTFFRIVADRYGEEAAAEYLLSAVQFLKDALLPCDRLFQWNSDVLLAVVQRQVSQAAVRMELTRLISKNVTRVIEFNLQKTMVSLSMTYDLLSIAQFSSLKEMLEAFNAKLVGRL